MIPLKDCSPIDLESFAYSYFGTRKKKALDSAKNWLVELSKRPPSSEGVFSMLDSMATPEPIVFCAPDGQWWTGRYIGLLCFNGITVEIQPRFEMEFIATHIPLNNFIPIDTNAEFRAGDKFMHYLRAVLWLKMLTKAARHSLPTETVQKDHVSHNVKGRIDVRQTLKIRTRDQGKIVSKSIQKNIQNPVTISIVLAYIEIQRWFPEHNLQHWLPETVGLRLQQMVDVIPKNAAIPQVKDIRKARLGTLSKAYRPLALLSQDILRKKGISEHSSDFSNKTLLLDVAELWELFVLDVLTEVASEEISVLHGTNDGKDYLLSNLAGDRHLGKLLPDYIFQNGNKVIRIADAKYKKLGDAPWMSPKRDDLYQMTAYLSRYSQCLDSCFYYPAWEGENNCDITLNNPWVLDSGQKIYFITLPSNKKAAVEKLRGLVV